MESKTGGRPIKINSAFLLVCLVLFSAGCKPNHHVVYEKFEATTLGDVNEEISGQISLRGSARHAGIDENSGMELTYVKSPYTLIVSFSFPKEMVGVVELKNISFLANDTLIRHVEVNRKEEFDNKTGYCLRGRLVIEEKEEAWALFLIEGVEIPHSKQKVVVNALISTEDGEVLKTWEFELTPVTEEEFRNNLRDSIMSV